MQLVTTISLMQTQAPGYTEEEQLIYAAQTNPEKFQPLYEKYYSPILRFVYQRTVSKEDAQDITQQVFLQAMINLPKYQHRGYPFSSWLYRIAINELNQVFRKNEKQRGVNLQEKHLKEMMEEMDYASATANERVLLDVITLLPEEDFTLIEMRFFEKRAFKEIAEILRSNEAAVKMRLYRILEKLKPELQKRLKN